MHRFFQDAPIVRNTEVSAATPDCRRTEIAFSPTRQAILCDTESESPAIHGTTLGGFCDVMAVMLDRTLRVVLLHEMDL